MVKEKDLEPDIGRVTDRWNGLQIVLASIKLINISEIQFYMLPNTLASWQIVNSRKTGFCSEVSREREFLSLDDNLYRKLFLSFSICQ